MKRRRFLLLAGLSAATLVANATDRNNRQVLDPASRSKLGRVIAQGWARGSVKQSETLLDRSKGCTQNIVTQNTQKVGQSTSVIHIAGDVIARCGR